MKAWTGFVATALFLAGCGEILVDGQMVELDGTGVVRGSIHLDQNGNRAVDPGDEPLSGASVQVVQPAGGSVVAAAVSDEAGQFLMATVPVGTFGLTVDPLILADTLEILGGESNLFVVAPDSVVLVKLRTSLRRYPPGEVLALEPGVPLFTTGVALNSPDSDGDGAVHLQNGDDYLRATNVEDAAITVGDTVRFRGRTALEFGLPVLDDVQPFLVREGADAPTPVERSTSDAAEADGGTLNAALVRIRDAEILDTATVDGDLVATVDDGSGPVDLVLRDYLNFDTGAFAPELARITEASGLLVAHKPGEELRWRILPRFPEDVNLE